MTIKLPPLPQPFSFAVHPSYCPENPSPFLDLDIYDHSPFERVTRDYADRFELYQDEIQRQRLANIHCSWLGAMMYPTGTEELLQVGVDFCMWAFAYDDEYCDEGPIARDPNKLIQASVEIWRQFESPEYQLTNDRYALAARDLRIRLDKYAKPEQTGRFVEAMRIYLMAEMWKATNATPTVSDCVFMRATGGGAWAFPALGHAIADIDITQREYEDRRVRALFEMLSSLMAWETEPHAFSKEMERGANYKEHNLIRVMMRENQCSFDSAVEDYLEMRLRLLSLFLRLKAEVDSYASEGVKAYIESVIRYYVGATVWSQNTRRYKSLSGNIDDHIFVGGQLTAPQPPEVFSNTKPIDIDGVRWWWEYDPLNKQASDGATLKYRPASV
ncbi:MULTISPECIES: terpene synthase family protein [Pseudomonas]|uniref:terpene synthase family protein n=1 Tax=Pseudomonas TaxID=286 RepID=UPI00236254FE|nr:MULTISPECIES: terpene synthase family protein [Pseudomonas]WJV26459.1 terpene synthase family protein [Pseudomonas chlororaphis]